MDNEKELTFAERFPHATLKVVRAYNKLVATAKFFGIRDVLFAPLNYCDGILYGHYIGINESLTEPEFVLFVVAHETAHYLIHQGDLIKNRDRYYEDQADNLAFFFCELLGVNVFKHLSKTATNMFISKRSQNKE